MRLREGRRSPPSAREASLCVRWNCTFRKIGGMFAAVLRWLAFVGLLALVSAHGGTDHSPKNCLCECSNGRRDAIFLPNNAECTKSVCFAMSSCPSPGSHNPDADVTATPIDCKCHCCETSSCQDDVYAYFLTPNGRKSECSATTCGEQEACSGRPSIYALHASETSSSSSSSGLSGGAIAGIVIGVIAGVALIAVAAYMLYPRRKPATSASWTDVHDEMHAQPQQQVPKTEAGMGDYLQ